MRTSEDGTSSTGSPPTLTFPGMRVHLIGIGGAGMSGIAPMLVDLGATVSGSDVSGFPGMGSLVRKGIRVNIGHQAEFLDPRTDLVVASAAIPPSNSELREADRLGIRVLKYAQLLGTLMTVRDGMAIAGTHGKTTTTAMCAHVLRQAGLDPSFIFGAHSHQLGGNSGVGSGPLFVVESCEFDRSFLQLAPDSAAILNVEPDHLDCFRGMGEIMEAFGQFAANVAGDGLVVCNADNAPSVEAAGQANAQVETFGIRAEADWQAVNLSSRGTATSFDVKFMGSVVASVELAIPGRHNVENALAAVALSAFVGVDPDVIAKALSQFTGVSRRLDWRGAGGGINIIDDYAHHPTEIRVTIEAALDRYKPKRTWVVFQPHQHQRTKHLLDEFASSFTGVDEVIIPDVFDARESDEMNHAVGSKVLASRICDNGERAIYVATLEEATNRVVDNAMDGDLVVTMGAGDVWKVADALVERFC